MKTMIERTKFLDKIDMMQELQLITKEEDRLAKYRERVLELYMEAKFPEAMEDPGGNNIPFNHQFPPNDKKEYVRILTANSIDQKGKKVFYSEEVGPIPEWLKSIYGKPCFFVPDKNSLLLSSRGFGRQSMRYFNNIVNNFNLSHGRNDNPCHRPHTSLIQPAVNILSKRCMLTPDQMKEFDLLYLKFEIWKHKELVDCKRPRCVVNHALTFDDPEEDYNYTMARYEFQSMDLKYRFNKKGNFQIKTEIGWKNFNVKFFEFFDDTHRGPKCK